MNLFVESKMKEFKEKLISSLEMEENIIIEFIDDMNNTELGGKIEYILKLNELNDTIEMNYNPKILIFENNTEKWIKDLIDNFNNMNTKIIMDYNIFYNILLVSAYECNITHELRHLKQFSEYGDLIANSIEINTNSEKKEFSVEINKNLKHLFEIDANSYMLHYSNITTIDLNTKINMSLLKDAISLGYSNNVPIYLKKLKNSLIESNK
jgi:hypothetical protein